MSKDASWIRIPWSTPTRFPAGSDHLRFANYQSRIRHRPNPQKKTEVPEHKRRRSGRSGQAKSTKRFEWRSFFLGPVECRAKAGSLIRDLDLFCSSISRCEIIGH